MYDQAERLVDGMAHYLISYLEGSHPNQDRIVIPTTPSRELILNSLSGAGSQSIDFEQLSQTMIMANAMSISFLTDLSIDRSIRVTPKFNVYYRCYPNWNEQTKRNDTELIRVWKRYEHHGDDIEIKLNNDSPQSYTLNLENLNNFINGDLDRWVGGSRIDESELSEEKTFNLAIQNLKNQFQDSKTNSIPNWTIQIDTEVIPYDESLHMVKVRLVNETLNPSIRVAQEPSTFANQIQIECVDFIPIPFQIESSNDDEPSTEIPIRSTNCHAIITDKIITSVNGASYLQNRLSPNLSILKGIELSFSSLQDPKTYHKILIELREYLNQCFNKLYQEDDNKHSEVFKQIIQNYNDGLSIITKDDDVRKAFLLMQRTFNLASEYNGWYVFQLVFIVSMIPSLVDRNIARNEAILLHVGTGSGKSESYFALVTFLLFYERIVGKHFGVSAWTKFPLRMLSIQQLERIAKIFIWAEEVRVNDQIQGEEFSIGYYVGMSREFPNDTKQVISNIQNDIEQSGESIGKVIQQCPICESEGKEAKIILHINSDRHEVLHKCVLCNREWKFYFNDEEVYRFLPSFIVSTVDKLSAIASNRRFRSLLGSNVSVCPKGHGYIPSGDKCQATISEKVQCKEENDTIIENSVRPGPSLIVQDELHLIREGFGTVGSHFETLLQSFQHEVAGTEPKYLGMTATITGADHQVRQLYNKDTNIFPGKYIELSNVGNESDPFFHWNKKSNEDKQIQRFFLGFKPNFRDNNYACLLSLRHISNYLSDCYYSKLFPNNVLEKYSCALTYHGKKNDVFAMNRFLSDAVNSKLTNSTIIGKPITGDNTLDEIRETIVQINNHSHIGDKEFKVHTLFSTNIVSHGVDINRWNIMLFQGMPNHTSEYIQAYSRVGRKLPALVINWYYPTRVRDLSFYRNFFEYHQSLEKRVESIPISRWARLGIYETITSVMCAGIINYISHINDRPYYTVDDVSDYFSDSEHRRQLLDFINKCYMIQTNSPIQMELETVIASEIEERLNFLASYQSGTDRYYFPNALSKHTDRYYQRQYGMRGIQASIVLRTRITDELYLSRRG